MTIEDRIKWYYEECPKEKRDRIETLKTRIRRSVHNIDLEYFGDYYTGKDIELMQVHDEFLSVSPLSSRFSYDRSVSLTFYKLREYPFYVICDHFFHSGRNRIYHENSFVVLRDVNLFIEELEKKVNWLKDK